MLPTDPLWQRTTSENMSFPATQFQIPPGEKRILKRYWPPFPVVVAALLLASAFPGIIVGANFSDDFSKGLNTNFWTTYQNTAGLYSVDTNHGSLQVTRTTMTNSGGTRYVEFALDPSLFNGIMYGDFSTDLKFTNAVLPGPGIDQIGLQADFYDGSYFLVGHDNENGSSAFVADGSTHGLTNVSGGSGTLSVERAGNILSGYYNGSPIFSKTNTSPLTYILFFVQSGSTDDLSSVAFDGFSLSYPILHPFSGTPFEGSNPLGGLVLSGQNLFGTTSTGGSTGNGTLYRINANGTGFTNLYTFTALDPSTQTNGDGAQPAAALTLVGDGLYGTAQGGGAGGAGTVFKINPDGTGFSNLFSFPLTSYDTNDGIIFANYTNGWEPQSGLVASGNTLFGTTYGGGTWNDGTIFKINTDGTGFTNLYSFSSLEYSASGYRTNDDGAEPTAGLVLSGNVLYGTASIGGFGYGCVFKINTDGTGFTNLHGFSTGALLNSIRTNADGINPMSGLFLSGNTLYGAARSGGTSGAGTIFKLNTDGTGFVTLYSFPIALPGPPYNGTNSSGANPLGAIVGSGNSLYGTASKGGSGGQGVVFAINTDGTGLQVLRNFMGGADGTDPQAGLVFAGNSLYGTTRYGGISQLTLYGQGTANSGTVFTVAVSANNAPQLAITLSGPAVILTWPAGVTGSTLQSTTNLASPGAWQSVSPGPVVNNGLNTVTNPVVANQMFYRLTEPGQ